MSQDTSTFNLPFMGGTITIRCELEAGHYDDPLSFHEGHLGGGGGLLFKWNDAGNRVLDDGVFEDGVASEVGFDNTQTPYLTAAWPDALGEFDTVEKALFVADSGLSTFASQIESAEDRLTALEAPPENWHLVGSGGGEPAFEHGWGNITTANKTAFRINRGLLEISINVTGGTVNTSIFTLPSGYRPSVGFSIACFASTDFTALTNTAAQIAVGTDGVVVQKLPLAGNSYLLSSIARVPFDPPAIA